VYVIVTDRGVITPKASDYVVDVSPTDDFRESATYPRNYPGTPMDPFDDEASYNDAEIDEPFTGVDEVIIRQQQVAGGDSLLNLPKQPAGFSLFSKELI
jgi:hypothetical protein